MWQIGSWPEEALEVLAKFQLPSAVVYGLCLEVFVQPSCKCQSAANKQIIDQILFGGNESFDCLLLLGQPEKAMLHPQPAQPVEDKEMWLTCYSKSTSVPIMYHTAASMTYDWTLNGQPINANNVPSHLSFEGSSRNILQIVSVSRSMTGQNYSCSGREEGSNLTSAESIILTVDVACEYLCLHDVSLTNFLTNTEDGEDSLMK